MSEDVAFGVLAAGNAPDFRTLSEFQRRHRPALEGLFTQVLRVARQAGAAQLGRVAIDGSRVKANASKHTAMSCGRMCAREEQLEQEVHHLLTQAAATDAQEDACHGRDRRGDDVPAARVVKKHGSRVLAVRWPTLTGRAWC